MSEATLTDPSFFGDKGFKLLHLSDLHWSSPKLGFKSLFSKKIIGHSNLRGNKAKREKKPEAIERLENLLDSDSWDLLCLSGDLSHVSDKKEFLYSVDKLNEFRHSRPILIIPGNHDRYTRGTIKSGVFEECFSDLSCIDLKKFKLKKLSHFYASDSCLLTAFETARPTNIFSSRGKFHRSSQSHSNPGKDFEMKIAVGHYNLSDPTKNKTDRIRALAGRKFLSAMLRELGYSYYLHGHVHLSWAHDEGDSLLSINSAGWDKPTEAGGGYHLFDISSDGEVEVSLKDLFA